MERNLPIEQLKRLRKPLFTRISRLIFLSLLLPGCWLPLKTFAQFRGYEWKLNEEIHAARVRLHEENPALTGAELNRFARENGRSNYLAFVIVQVFMMNNVSNIDYLLTQFPGDINKIRPFGNTPLIVQAARMRNSPLLEVLLKHKANPSLAGPDGYTALAIAIQGRDWPAALRLIAAGADVNPVSTNSSMSTSPLAQVVNQWWPGVGPDSDLQMQVLQQLLDHGAGPFGLMREGQAESLLEDLSRRNTPAILDLLLTNHPSATNRTVQGETAFHLAARWGRTNVMDFLKTSGIPIDQTNNDGLTALQAIVGSSSELDMLLPRNGPFGVQMVRWTMQANSADGLHWLLDHGAKLDVWSAAGLGKTNELASMLHADPALANARDGLGRTPLHYAAFNSQNDAAKLLLDSGAYASVATTKGFAQRPNGQIAAGATALHFAAMRGNEKMVAMLLKAGAPVGVADEAGDTALHFAARHWTTAAVGVLIRAHASLDVTNHNGQTPLRAAVETASTKNVEDLLNAGANPQIGSADENLLHIAAERGNPEVITLLLKHGFKVDSRDAKGRTPFQHAVMHQQWGTANLLLSKSADINAADAEGNTALHLLASQSMDSVWHQVELSWWEREKSTWFMHPGFRHNTITNLANWKIISIPTPGMMTNTSLTAWLLEHKAKPNLANHRGQTPLHILCTNDWAIYNQLEASNRVAVLLKGGAKVDVADVRGVTPILAAAGRAPASMLALLFKHAGNINRIHDEFGETLLHLAATNHQFDSSNTVSLLLQNHADPNARDRLGRTPLLLMARALYKRDFNLHVEVMDELLKAGADVSLYDNEGETFLDLWCKQNRSHWYNYDELVRKWLTAHPDLLKITNAAGDTLLHTALQFGNHEVIRTALESGADPMMRNARGESVMYLAQKDEGGSIANMIHPKDCGNSFYWAIASRNKKEFESFLKTEPKLASITFSNGQTALVRATERGVPKEFAVRLLELGARLDPISALRLGRLMDARLLIACSTNLPAHLWFEAIALKHFDDIKDLAAGRVDLNALDGDGHTLYFHAAADGQTNAANWLKSRGAKENFVDAIGLGDTNFLAAALDAHPGLANSPCAHEQTTLMVAARSRQPGSARVLIAHGAKLDDQDALGWTALHVACNWGADEVAGELVRAGASTDAMESNGFTPLHLAAMNGRTKIAQVLIDHGANVNQPTGTPSMDNPRMLPVGSTALHWAAISGRADVVKLLLESRAEVNATNAAGETPLDVVGASRYRQWTLAWYTGIGTRAGIMGVPLPRNNKTWKGIETDIERAGGVRKAKVESEMAGQRSGRVP